MPAWLSGRALASHARGHKFESYSGHQHFQSSFTGDPTHIPASPVLACTHSELKTPHQMHHQKTQQALFSSRIHRSLPKCVTRSAAEVSAKYSGSLARRQFLNLTMEESSM